MLIRADTSVVEERRCDPALTCPHTLTSGRGSHTRLHKPSREPRYPSIIIIWNDRPFGKGGCGGSGGGRGGGGGGLTPAELEDPPTCLGALNTTKAVAIDPCRQTPHTPNHFQNSMNFKSEFIRVRSLDDVTLEGGGVGGVIARVLADTTNNNNRVKRRGSKPPTTARTTRGRRGRNKNKPTTTHRLLNSPANKGPWCGGVF